MNICKLSSIFQTLICLVIFSCVWNMIYSTPPLIQLTIRLQHSWAAKNFYKTPDTDSTSLVSVHVCVWSQDQVDPGHKSLQSSNTILGSILLSSASTSFCTWDHTVSHDQWSQGAPVWDQHHWCQCSIWAARTPSSSSVYMSTGATTCPLSLLSHTHSSVLDCIFLILLCNYSQSASSSSDCLA